MHKFQSLKIASMILIFSFLETTVLADIIFFGAKIELLLMLAVFLSFFSSVKFGKQVYLAAFFCGAAKDILSALPLGVNTLTFLLAAFLAGQVSKHIFASNKLFFSVLVFLGALIQNFISLFLSGEMRTQNFPMSSLRIILFSAFISTLFSPLIFSFFKLTLSANENT